VALVPEAAGPQLGDDIRVLLRKRLLFIALLLWASAAVGCVALVVAGLTVDKTALMAVAVAVLATVLARVLWVRRSLSLRQLRRIELVLFGSFYLHWFLVHAFLFPTLRLDRYPH
jgi:hypothetical protein